MADQSTQSIEIDAAPAEIMAVIADFDHYPLWATSVKQAQVLEADAGILRDHYELTYGWHGDARVEWQLVRGQMMRDQQGCYDLRAGGNGMTQVTYSLSVELAIPMLGLLKRKAERVVMDTALKQLKARVEGLRV